MRKELAWNIIGDDLGGTECYFSVQTLSFIPSLPLPNASNDKNKPRFL